MILSWTALHTLTASLNAPPYSSPQYITLTRSHTVGTQRAASSQTVASEGIGLFRGKGNADHEQRTSTFQYSTIRCDYLSPKYQRIQRPCSLTVPDAHEKVTCDVVSYFNQTPLCLKRTEQSEQDPSADNFMPFIINSKRWTVMKFKCQTPHCNSVLVELLATHGPEKLQRWWRTRLTVTEARGLWHVCKPQKYQMLNLRSHQINQSYLHAVWYMFLCSVGEPLLSICLWQIEL